MDIDSLPKHERPREKMQERGVASLTDLELFIVLLGSGVKGRPVQTVAADLLSLLDDPYEVSFERLRGVQGIGEARAAICLAALELRRRSLQPEQVVIRQPRDVMPLVHEYRDKRQEHFIVMSLNGGHGVIRTEVVTVGLANFCCVHPREVFARPIVDRATAVVLAHNHPSGSLEPSAEDIATTRRLVAAAHLLGLTVLDHVIFSRSGFRSLRSDRPELFTARDYERYSVKETRQNPLLCAAV